MSLGGDSSVTVDEADPRWLADADTFRREITARCQPAVLRGALREWPIVRAAEDSPATCERYLRGFATAVPAEAFIGEPAIGGRYYYSAELDGFNFERQSMDLPTAITRVRESAATAGSPTVYVGSLPCEVYLPGLAADNPAPMLPTNVNPRVWIGNASYVSCHYDTFDNFACVVAGRRRFTLYPPDAISSLYVGPIDYTMAGQPVSLADGSEPGDPRFPAFEAVRDRAIKVDLGPGDALYLPKLWWHRVEATAPFNVLVNYWWDDFAAGPDAPSTTMLLAMTAIAERPAAERAAWKAFFDHYVFRPNGHPLAHLPENRRGILGSTIGGFNGRIRSHVMRLLRGDQ